MFTEVLVLGCGVAGLSAALAAGGSTRVIAVTKGTPPDGCTVWAQGGIAAAVGADDDIESHVRDTLDAGAGLCAESVVRAVVGEGPRVAAALLEGGVALDRDGAVPALGREGGHRRPRILHAGGDATGRELARALMARVAASPNVRVQGGVRLVDLLTDAEGAVAGAIVAIGGELRAVRALETVVATGGACRIFRESTNPATATGDGLAAAFRAGATLTDLEFVQFHPTVLYAAGAARFLITEAVRGAGATLIDRAGRRFMADVHELADLAPRDVVVRAIQRRLAETGATHVYLDMTHLPESSARARFPGVFRTCAAIGLDPSREPIPVRPSAHYFIGGIRATIDGDTGVRGLSACGEASATGLHGANRLASNSLLEGLVAGARAGAAAATRCAGAAHREPEPLRAPGPAAAGIDIDDALAALRSLMGRRAGPERDDQGLADAAWAIDGWGRYVMGREFRDGAGWELQNMLLLAGLVVDAARRRTESRGTHCRSDHPARDDAAWLGHTDYARGRAPAFRPVAAVAP